MTTRSKFRTLILTLLVILSMVIIPSAFAQEEGGFTEVFDEINWEQWEKSQDVKVENGVLRLEPGNFVIRQGSWSDIDLTVMLRFSTPGEAIINYYFQGENHYTLILTGEMAIVEKKVGGNFTPQGNAPSGNLSTEEFNQVNIKVFNGTHTITINNEQVLSFTDPEPISGGGVMFHILGESSLEIDSISLQGNPAEPFGPDEEPPPEEAPGEDEPPPESAGEAPPPAESTDTGTEPTKLSLIEELMSGQSNQLELTTFLINLLLAAVAAFILGRVYIYWGTSLSNRRSFAANFMLLTVTTTFIILVVRSSVALSLGLVGALSIVRFRAAVKEPEELAYLFFAISLGIGLGDNQRLITLLSLVVGIAVIGLLRLFRNTKADVNLHLTVASRKPNKIDLDQVTSALEKHCSKIKLLRFDETEDALETSYLIEFKRVSDLSQARAELQALAPGLEISFLDNKGIW